MTRIKMPLPPCPCGRPYKARGLCTAHYRSALRGNALWAPQMSENVAPGAQWVNCCDDPGCDVYGLPSLVAPCGQGTHYCPNHYPLRRCRVCNREMRPEHTPADLWPETLSIGQQGRCHSCTLGMLESIDIDPLPEYSVRIVKRLVENHLDDPDDRLLVLSSLIGDDID